MYRSYTHSSLDEGADFSNCSCVCVAAIVLFSWRQFLVVAVEFVVIAGALPGDTFSSVTPHGGEEGRLHATPSHNY